MEISTQALPAPRSRRRRTADPSRLQRNLSVAAGADDRRAAAGQLARHHRAADRRNGCRSGSASRSSSRTGPAPPPISPPSSWCAPRRTATRCCSSLAGNAVNGAVFNKLNYDFIRDIAPVASIGGIPLAMVVTPSLPAKTVPEFIAYAKANPGKILMASSGNGSVLHIAGAMFADDGRRRSGSCPYRGTACFPICSADRCKSRSARCRR